jgi:hypothetical protein
MTSGRDNFGNLPPGCAAAIARAGDAQAAARRRVATRDPHEAAHAALLSGTSPCVAELERLILAWQAGPTDASQPPG